MDELKGLKAFRRKTGIKDFILYLGPNQPCQNISTYLWPTPREPLP